MIHRDAEIELAAEVSYYEGKLEGLGLDFQAEAEAAVNSIRVAPDRWPIGKLDTRRCLLHRFPFSVVYIDLPDHIWIVAFAHGSRKPYYWKHRIVSTKN